MTTVRDLFDGDRPSLAIQGSDCGALRLQRARLMEENERLRKALEWALPHARDSIIEALYGGAVHMGDDLELLHQYEALLEKSK